MKWDQVGPIGNSTHSAGLTAIFNSFHANDSFYRLQIIIPNSLDPYQDRQIVGADKDPNNLTAL